MRKRQKIIFVSYFENMKEIDSCLLLCKSIRKFIVTLNDAPIIVYYHEIQNKNAEKYQNEFSELLVELREIKVPQEAFKFALGGKPFIAAKAEENTPDKADILVFLDPNKIFIDEPKDFLLADSKHFAYRPVMHQNIGSLFAEKPNKFWKHLYEKFAISDESLFPMQTIADKKIIRPYFNAGFLILRPEYKILRKWAEYFRILYGDETIIEICKEQKYNIFLHQAALVGAVLNQLKQDELELLPFSYNYPLFFENFYDSEIRFDSIEDVISIKYEFNFKQLPTGWDKKLKGSKEILNWIKMNL
ncbi:MAG: hypothetical protein HQ534_01965 [Armatimonadetes bacterium]|nr:hypothetical protein [Armatimonadota bacterium]